MGKIVVRIWGGIGNQLFQYSFGEYLRNKYKLELEYDCNTFENIDKTRKLEIENIVDNLPRCNNHKISRYTGAKNRLVRFVYNFQNKFLLENNYKEKILVELLGEYEEIYLQGYWQKIEYAQWAKDINKLSLANIKLDERIKEYSSQICECPNSVCVHIRRGDYFTPRYIKTYGVCTPSYYHNAIKLIEEKLHNNIKYFIFSDDLQWVKENIQLPSNAVFIQNYDVPQISYIYLMSLCKHNIISNSTFSWWGAFLNSYKDKIVLAPNKWTFNSFDTLALDEWIQISI